MVIRTDLGTENCRLATIHIAFWYNHDDAMFRERSFIYGPSTSNIVSVCITSYFHMETENRSMVVTAQEDKIAVLDTAISSK